MNIKNIVIAQAPFLDLVATNLETFYNARGKDKGFYGLQFLVYS